MQKKPFLLSAILGLALILAACNMPVTPTPTPGMSDDAIGTAAALTVQALSTQLVSPVPPTQQATQPLPPTSTLPPTSAPPTNTPNPPTNTPLPKPDDIAGFVADTTVPDGTVFAPGTTFVKTWRLKNVGTSTWTTSYSLVFVSGDPMDAPASVPLTSSVSPGSEVDISVTLKAPATPKSYEGHFKLRNSGGVLFGLGPQADKTFFVKITVGKPTSLPFAVISVPTTVDVETFSGACPTTFNFEAKIKTSNAGLVKYHWKFSDGSSSSVKSLTFDEAGTKTVTTTWTLGSPSMSYAGWARIYIDEPNHQDFGKATFTMNCSP